MLHIICAKQIKDKHLNYLYSLSKSNYKTKVNGDILFFN